MPYPNTRDVIDHANGADTSARLAALRQTQLLDSAIEEAFDRLTRLAAKIIDAPVALISLVDEDRQFFKSSFGLPEPWASLRETPLTHSFCQHVSATGEPLLIADAREHPLVRDNLAIPDLGVVAYAGMPLRTAEGYVLGSFCVIDGRPRQWSEREIEILRELAALVMTEIRLRLTTREAERRAIEAEQQHAQHVAVLESISDAFFALDRTWRFTYLNTEAEHLLLRTRDELLGTNLWDAFPEAFESTSYHAFQRAMHEQITVSFEAFYPPLERWFAVRAYPIDDGLAVYFQNITQQRAAEAALQSSDERLRLAMDAARLGHWDWNIQTNTIVWSQNIELSLGLEPGSFGGTMDEFHAFVHPDDRVLVSQTIQQSLEQRAPYRLEFRMQRVDGGVLWIATEGQVFFDAAGTPIRMIGIYINITERKQVELALRESQERLRRVVETNDDGIIIHDTEGQITFANAAAERILGLTRSDMVGRMYNAPAWHITAVDGGPLPEARLPFAQVMRTGQPIYNSEFAISRPDNKRVILSVNAAPLQGEQIEGVVATFRDVSEYTRSEAMQRVLVRAGSILADTLDFDEMLARIARLGVPELADWCSVHIVEGERLSRSGVGHVDPSKEATIRAIQHRRHLSLDSDHPIAQVLRTGEPLLVADPWQERPLLDDPSVEQLLREVGFSSVMCMPLIARGRPLGVLQFVSAQPDRPYSERDLVVAQELARRAALALDNARLYQEAQQALQARDDLFSMVTHDLKNPLTTITGYADVLQRRVKRLNLAEPERLLDGLSRMRQAANKMTQQLNELLDTAVIRSGGTIELQREYSDLVALVRQICEEQQPQTHQHRVQFDTSEAELIGQFDARRLERVFTNLLANAIKYSPDGGTIMISVAHRQAPDGDWAVVTVADEGIGIPAADLPHIFERFRRGSNVDGIKGNGIGLATVASIVEQHGGLITVEIVAGQGTTFTVQLPLVARLLHAQIEQNPG